MQPLQNPRYLAAPFRNGTYLIGHDPQAADYTGYRTQTSSHARRGNILNDHIVVHSF
jgi:hypothetical protein